MGSDGRDGDEEPEVDTDLHLVGLLAQAALEEMKSWELSLDRTK